MTLWLPKIPQGRRGQTEAIVAALATDIASGTLRPGQRLPTHRELAFRLGIAVATVTKAYTEAKRHGYLRSGVGDGTFVLEPLLAARRRIRPDDVTTDGIDLSFNTSITTLGQDAAIAETLERLGHDRQTVQSLLNYHRPWSGHDRHRRTGVAWLDALGIAANPEDVTVTCGTQHAGCIALLSNLSAGDILLTEELTDPLTKFLATTLRFELRSVQMDEQGLCIKALGEACRGGRARGLLCMPDHQSPTAIVMPEARRRAIAELARRHDLMIMENAVYRPLVPDAPPPISAFAPERSFIFSSFSKIIAPGLRTGFLVAPPGRTRDLILGLGATSWMASPITTEIACRWIEDGTAVRLANLQREELQARNSIAARLLERFRPGALPSGMHVWLTLPSPWRVDAFVRELAANGTMVLPSDAFAVGRTNVPHAVRISLGGAVDSRARLEEGLSTIATLLIGRGNTAYVPV
jgi:DNA-binding transcriptional MocR family regulator